MYRSRNSTTPLLSYDTIAAASTGDSDALVEVLRHFDGLISTLATRTFYDANGISYRGVDYDLKERMKLKLVASIVQNFDPLPQ